MSNHELSVLFFLQLTIILAAVRLAGTLARKAGQPRVVGEMIAGILIGPTLLGRMFPELHARLIPAQSKPIIYAVCQIGIVLYMFIVGLEFQIDLVRPSDDQFPGPAILRLFRIEHSARSCLRIESFSVGAGRDDYGLYWQRRRLRVCRQTQWRKPA